MAMDIKAAATVQPSAATKLFSTPLGGHPTWDRYAVTAREPRPKSRSVPGHSQSR
jgi:hypothetical protein